tara:strand:+ start:13569 stop:14504 length:936 start_codon:yes stop_codon:yes gene_type:complete
MDDECQILSTRYSDVLGEMTDDEMKNYEGNKSERDNITALLNSHVQCFNGSVYPNLAKKVSKLKEWETYTKDSLSNPKYIKKYFLVGWGSVVYNLMYTEPTSKLDAASSTSTKRKRDDAIDAIDLLHVGPYLQHGKDIYIKDVENKYPFVDRNGVDTFIMQPGNYGNIYYYNSLFELYMYLYDNKIDEAIKGMNHKVSCIKNYNQSKEQLNKPPKTRFNSSSLFGSRAIDRCSAGLENLLGDPVPVLYKRFCRNVRDTVKGTLKGTGRTTTKKKKKRKKRKKRKTIKHKKYSRTRKNALNIKENALKKLKK